MSSQTCRTCLQRKEQVTTLKPGTDLATRLQRCVPEINMYTVSNAMICYSCVNTLKMIHDFRAMCLNTEKKISSHLETLYLTSLQHRPKLPPPHSFEIDSTVHDYMNESILEAVSKPSGTSNGNNEPGNRSCTVVLEDVLKTEKIDISEVTLQYGDDNFVNFDVVHIRPEQTNKEPLGRSSFLHVTNKKLETTKHVVTRSTSSKANVKQVVQNKGKVGRKRSKQVKLDKKLKILKISVQDIDQKYKSLQLCVICEKVFKTKADLGNHVIEHIHV